MARPRRLQGTLYRKDYTLRGVGDHIEVWVANDTSFPAGDCRNQVPNTTVVTDAQVADLVHEFDTNMYPKETAAFSTPPDRDGTNALLGPDANGNGGVYTGDGNKTVTLVDNIRDDNYYTFPAAPTYIAGFYSSQFNELFDRNVMTIDAFDWLHRTGDNPRTSPPTTCAPAARRAPTSTRARSRTSGSTSRTTTRTRSRRTGSTRACPTSRRRSPGTSTRPPPSSTGAPTATSTASRASARCRPRTTPTRATAVDRRTP